MYGVFLAVLKMSLTASYAIIIVILARLLLKKAPKVISYALWLVVGFRLVFPFSFESIFSFIPRSISVTSVSTSIAYSQSAQSDGGIKVADSFAAHAIPSQVANIKPIQLLTQIGAYIWVLGIVVLLFYSVISVLLLRKRLRKAVLIEKNVYIAENFKTAFVFGLIRPKIYLPIGLKAEEKQYIILHEQKHISRCDYMIKPLAFLILSIHWFNPFVWIAFKLMCSDMEFSCDEGVLKKLNVDIKKNYASLLLSLAIDKPILNGSPLAFGEGSLKNRIKNILKYKKPSYLIIVASIIIVVVIGIGLISNPRKLIASQNTVVSNNSTSVSSNTNINRSKLEDCIREAIISFNGNKYRKSDFATEAHTVFKTVEKDNTTIVYAMVLYLEFDYSGSSFSETGGSHMPVAITFKNNTMGEYELAEYWIPKDGSYYITSIKDKFPLDTHKEAIDTQKYVVSHIQACYAQAIEYGKIDVNTELSKQIEMITSSPSYMSNPGAYIKEHVTEYRKLIYFGKYTLQYSFNQFKKGDITGLDGHILALACREILGDEDIKTSFSTGQEWFEAFKKQVVKLRDEKGNSYMEKNKPGAWLLLKILDK